MSTDSSANPLQDLQRLREQLDRESGNPAVQSKYFWTLHQQLKQFLTDGAMAAAADCVVEMGQHQLALDRAANATGWGVHKLLRTFKDEPRSTRFDEARVAALVDTYLRTVPFLPGPDKLHSAMLWITTQLQGEDPTSWYVPLVRTVGFDRMQPADFEGKEVNGYLLPSLAERVAVAAAKSVEAAPDQADIDWLMPRIESLLERKPQNVWLKYHKAKLLLAMECRNEAREYVRPVVTGKRTEFWAWAVLGETFVSEEPAKALSCFCKAITLKDDEVFLLNVRELLAGVLVALDRLPEAKGEIERLVGTRRNKGYKIPSRVTSLLNAPWYASIQGADNSQLYIREARIADDLLFENAETFRGVVTNIDVKSRSCFVTFRLDCSARYRYHRTPWGKELPDPGMFVTIRVRQTDAEGARRFEAVSMQPSTEPPDPSFARAFNGDIKIVAKPGKDPIGFVADVFIPSVLLRQSTLTNGSRAAGVAVKEMNRTKGEYGWRAISVGEAPHLAPATPPEPLPAAAVPEPAPPAPVPDQPVTPGEAVATEG